MAALVSMVTDVAGVLVAGVGVLAAIIGAWLGFRAWRRELRGTTQYHVARKVLQGVYRLRDGLLRTRMPGDPFDPHGRSLVDEESAHLFTTRNLEADYVRRTEVLVTDRQDLLIAEQEAMALWGNEAGVPLRRLYGITANLMEWAERYFKYEHLRDLDDPPQPRTAEMERLHTLIYRQGKQDWFDQQIESAVQEAEAWYRPHLR